MWCKIAHRLSTTILTFLTSFFTSFLLPSYHFCFAFIVVAVALITTQKTLKYKQNRRTTFFSHLQEEFASSFALRVEKFLDKNPLAASSVTHRMNGNIHGLSWFPNFHDKFVIWGQEINLYEVRATVTDNEPGKAHSMAFLASESRYQYVRCLQPSYHKDSTIIAVGLADGKVGLCNFQDTVDSSWEFTPRQQRSCLCLAWNECEPNLLAMGHDRNRSDSCITVWDIERGLPKETSNFFGHSESAHSMCWDKQHRVLITGMSQKQIKLFDLRQSNATCQSIQTKTVHGLGVASNGYYLCSYLDSVIMLWDLRAIERPLKQIHSSKNLSSLSWCPTRSSLLTSLQRESPFINLYDIRSVDVENVRDVYHIKKQLLPFYQKLHAANKGNALTALSWHPSDFERALVLSDSGSILDYKLPLTILTAFNNRNQLPGLVQRSVKPTATSTTPTHNSSNGDVLNGNGGQLNLQDLLQNDLVEDTRKRSLQDYGLKTNVRHLSELNLSSNLKTVWQSLANLYRDDRLTGLKTILGIGLGHTSEALMSTARNESHVLQWPDFINKSNHLVCYRSEQRDLALRLCGWTHEQDLERFIASLCEQKEFSRAAMIYVFHLKILPACEILSKAAGLSTEQTSMFTIAALALYSFNADNCSVAWRKQRSNVNMQIQNPHLRAIFSFLTTENDNFDAVLNEEELSLSDRVAFACKYLSESKLAEYVRQLIQKSIEKGDLNGLLITGESLDGINILQAYIDYTSDVQTVALIAINYFHREHFMDQRIQYWISSYLDHLNSWGLWVKRAELEIKIKNICATPRATRTVFLSCNFCGKSVSNALQEDARIRNATSNINKLSSCPSCRKPLPRCSMCRLHMGTTVSSAPAGDAAPESLGWQSKSFSKWFAWCQTCRHGGHTEHIMEWFKQNSECPDFSCSCKCFDNDALKPQTTTDVS